MEPRVIDGKLFLVSRNGRRELIATPGEIIDGARREIEECSRQLHRFAEDENEARRRIELALLEGEPTDRHRQELAALLAEAAKLRNQAADAQRVIDHARALSDRHEADHILAARNTILAASLAHLQIPRELRYAA